MTGATEPDVAAMPPYADISRINVTLIRAGLAPGYLFLSPQSMREPGRPHGPQIADDQGRVVWFHPCPRGQYATNVRVQRYQGEPVLTWWQGTATDTGVGRGRGYIVDRNYNVVATVDTDDDHGVDLHEFLLTERDTAIVISYQLVEHDLTPINGQRNAPTIDGVVQEIDIETGTVLFRWSGLATIPLRESDLPVQLSDPYDHLHLNAVDLDDDGNLLITARNNSALYKVHRTTGEVIWKLGSGYSSFVLGVGVRSNWIHDGRAAGGGVYRIFDNGANDYLEGYESRVVWVRTDLEDRTARFVGQLTHPDHLSSIAEGNAQELPNGNTLVGWGRAARISEFSPSGELLFDAETPSGPGWTTYRVYRQEWDGHPSTPPEIFVDDARVHAVWNGATRVARWRLLGGANEDRLRPIGSAEWDGLDTPIELSGSERPPMVRVEALDADGTVLGTSKTIAF